MKRVIFIALVGLGMVACNDNAPAKGAEAEQVAPEVVNSAANETVAVTSEHDGVYTAVLPGADKGDNEVEIVIKGDTYTRTEKQGEESFSDEGTVSVQDGIITLKANEGDREEFFKITPTGFLMLDFEKQEPEGVTAEAYNFTKK